MSVWITCHDYDDSKEILINFSLVSMISNDEFGNAVIHFSNGVAVKIKQPYDLICQDLEEIKAQGGKIYI
jgi:hypothetical protein